MIIGKQAIIVITIAIKVIIKEALSNKKVITNAAVAKAIPTG